MKKEIDLSKKEVMEAILNLDNDELFAIVTNNNDEFILPCDLPSYIDTFSLEPNIQSREDWTEYYRFCRENAFLHAKRGKPFFSLFDKARKKLARATPDRILAMHIAKNNLSWEVFCPDNDIAF